MVKTMENGHEDFLQIVKEYIVSLTDDEDQRTEILSSTPEAVTIRQGKVQQGGLTGIPTYKIIVEYEDLEKTENEVTVYDLDDYLATIYSPEIDPKLVSVDKRAKIALAGLTFSRNPAEQISQMPDDVAVYLQVKGFIDGRELTRIGRKEALMDLDYLVSVQ
jgi:hypothetical protein